MKSIIFLFFICCNSLICWAQGVHTNYLFPEFTDSYIYYKDGKTEELQNCDDIFGDDWGAIYLSMDNNCFNDYIESEADLDINKLMKLEDKIITNNEVKNWIPGISAVIFYSRIEYD